jgi:hypothetical protein
MKPIMFVIISSLLLLPLAKADTTFFDNPNGAFIVNQIPTQQSQTQPTIPFITILITFAVIVLIVVVTHLVYLKVKKQR